MFLWEVLSLFLKYDIIFVWFSNSFFCLVAFQNNYLLFNKENLIRTCNAFVSYFFFPLRIKFTIFLPALAPSEISQLSHASTNHSN